MPSRCGRRRALPDQRPRHRTLPALTGHHIRRGSGLIPVRAALLPGTTVLKAAVLLTFGNPAAHAQIAHSGDVGAGTTCNVTGCHLHFEVVRNGRMVDPQGWVRL